MENKMHSSQKKSDLSVDARFECLTDKKWDLAKKQLIKLLSQNKDDEQLKLVLNNNKYTDEEIEELICICKIEFNRKRKWREARKGVFIVMAVHFLFEVLTGNMKVLVSLLITYLIASWILKSQIKKRDDIECSSTEFDKVFMKGIIVYCILIIIRIGFGVIQMFVLTP